MRLTCLNPLFEPMFKPFCSHYWKRCPQG